jgi:hypothetical protein
VLAVVHALTASGAIAASMHVTFLNVFVVFIVFLSALSRPADANPLLAAPIDDATVDYDGSSPMMGSSVMGGSVSWSTTAARWTPRWLAPSHVGEVCQMPAVSVSATATRRTIVPSDCTPLREAPLLHRWGDL